METNTSQDIWEKFPKEYVGLVGTAFGLLFLLGAILNWDWVLEGDGRIMNIAWVSNTFQLKPSKKLNTCTHRQPMCHLHRVELRL